MDNCWLSLEGEVFYCSNHDKKAWDLVQERYGIDKRKIKEPSIYLGARNWIAYHNRPWWRGWWIYCSHDPSQYYVKDPTQAQINKVYELTGEIYDEDTRKFVKK